MNRTILTLSTLAAVLLTTSAQAQHHFGGHYHGGHSFHHYAGHPASFGYYAAPAAYGYVYTVAPANYGYWASMYNPELQAARAAKLTQDAERIRLDNIEKTRAMKAQLRAEWKQGQAARLEAARGRAAERKQNAPPAKPQRPSGAELSHRGEIQWPCRLQESDFAAHRERLTELFAQRAANGGAGLGSELCQDVAHECGNMLMVLKKHAGEGSPNDWIEARRFVTNLANEAKITFPVDQLAKQ